MYKIERDEDLSNVWYIVDATGVCILRWVGDKDDLDGLMSHLNR